MQQLEGAHADVAGGGLGCGQVDDAGEEGVGGEGGGVFGFDADAVLDQDDGRSTGCYGGREEFGRAGLGAGEGFCRDHDEVEGALCGCF